MIYITWFINISSAHSETIRSFVPVQNRTRRAWMTKDVWGETGFAISSDESPEKCELTGSSTGDLNEKWTASFDWRWNHQEPNVAIAENSAFHFDCVRAVTCSLSLMKKIPGNRANCVETEHLRAQVCQFFTVGQTQNLMWRLSATAYLQRINDLHPNNNNTNKMHPFWLFRSLQVTKNHVKKTTPTILPT